jgi:hypothetical protein
MQVAIEGENDDVAVYCDRCNAPIGFYEAAWMVHTGEVVDGQKVVNFICQKCHDV